MGTYSNSPSYKYYLDEIGKTPLITREEEAQLATKSLVGDRKAQEKLAKAHLRFVVSVANLYSWSDVAIEDLVNAGNTGLAIAIKLYHPDRNARLISYAVWPIRQHIREEVARFQHIISSRTHIQNEFYAIRKALETAVAGQSGAPLSPEQLKELGISETQMREAFATATHRSLDEHFSDSDSSLHDLLVDERAISPDAIVDQRHYAAVLADLLQVLTDEEREIFRYMSGMEDGQRHLLKEAAERFQMTTTMVQARFTIAKRKLKIAARKLTETEGGGMFSD
ncbi:MAG: sigma-70 family RNA polymerase sigma factor [Patescibacteria group bacterium]|jgi:RNA polymerase primary sigma factor